jgi:hypothetical protein
MQISFRSILYNYFRNIFLRVLTNAWETVWGITRCCGGQHATTAALLIAIVASILTRGARPCTRVSMHKRGHHEHIHGGHQSVAAGWSTYTTTRLLYYTIFIIHSIITRWKKLPNCFQMYFETRQLMQCQAITSEKFLRFFKYFFNWMWTW